VTRQLKGRYNALFIRHLLKLGCNPTGVLGDVYDAYLDLTELITSFVLEIGSYKQASESNGN